jgi:hypothetical protein
MRKNRMHGYSSCNCINCSVAFAYLTHETVVNLSGPVITATSSGYTKEVDDIFKMLSPPIMTFITNLPAIEGTVA